MMTRFALFLSFAALALAALWLTPAARTDQPSYDTVGPIEGEAISVQGSLNIEVVQGRTKTILRSGSDVRVNSGQARIDLVEGGQIVVCGPAHFSVLKSVNLLTLALDSGIIHAHIEREPALTVYTPQIQAKPFAINEGAQDTLVGFDPTGAMCIRADRGAVRVEQQLSGQSIVVPQSGEVLISNGQLEGLRSGVTHCACELQLAKTLAPAPTQIEVSRLPTSEEMQKANRELAKTHAETATNTANVSVNVAPPKATPPGSKPSAEVKKPSAEESQTSVEVSQPKTETAKAPAPAHKPAASDGPVYQVFMPPLSYDASAKAQPDNFDPQLIVLVRRVRVRPTLIFQGSVKDAPPVAKKAEAASPEKAAAPPAAATQQAQQKAPAKDSIIARIRAFFRSLFS